jgi:predicted hydrocarbon binding protein
MEKRLKKELEINIDEKKGQLFFGDKKKDLKLLMLRPMDLIEFSEFAGTNADDILVWVGKTAGREFMEKFFYSKDWSGENMASKKEVIMGSLEAIELMGFGHIKGFFKKDHIIIEVEDSLACEERENVMSKNLCLLYQGIFNGLFEVLQMDVIGEEIGCVLLDEEKCTYKFDFISDQVDDILIDEDSEETVSDFLSTL